MKKFLSIILSILMIVTAMPMAFAADGHTHALSADGETVEFTELPADTTRIDTAGNYYLTQDMELTDNLWIEVEGTVNLCLNGHSITAVEDGSNQTVVFLYGGTLNLCDCKGGGCITSAEDLTFSGVRTWSDTEFNMYSGEIKNNYYYAVDCVDFNMYGGKLSGNKWGAVDASGTFNMYGGEISGNSGEWGTVSVSNNGSFTMYDGEIKDNINKSRYWNSGTVYAEDGTFTMKGGKIIGNTGGEGSGGVYAGAKFVMEGGEISGNSGYSGGVSVGNGGDFTMNGGAIKNNTASGRGGGVYLGENASFNMNGGEISGNTAEQGGGVFSTYDSAKINLKKGVITGNSATYAGGVGAQYANTPVEISGADVQIMNNTAPYYPNLIVNGSVTVSAPLDDAKTKIYLSVNRDIIAKPDGTNLTTLEGMEDCFVVSDEELFVMCNENGELVAIKWSATIAEKDGDLVVTATDNGGVTYQWYEVNGDELTELEGETTSTLAGEKLVVDKTYACRIYLAGEEIETLAIKYPYAITHQPTAGEPYVELNDDTDATYQWYAVEVNAEEITDENADTVAYDWGESSYSEETGWTGVPYEEEYNGQDFFTVELKAGETITVEVTGDFIDGVGLWDYDTENGAWVDSEEDVTSYELTVESEGNYTFYTYVNSGVVTVKAYKTAVEKTAIEGETSAELKNPEFGKKYVCEVTYGNGETEVSDAFEYTYAITHQPTEAEPYVELNDDTAASYQWYTVEGDGYEVTNENAFGDWQSIGFPISSTVYEDGKWIADDSMGMQYYFMVELEAGDTINFEFASEVEQIIFALDGNADEGIAVGGTECSVTVEESGAYWLITPPVDYVCADVGNIAYNAIEGETAAVLNPTALGKYACEVTFADGTTEMSDSFLVTTLHTCDFTGEWKYDADKHWKECTADGCSKISEEAEHSFTDSKCACGYACPHSSYTDGICDNCDYECPHENYTDGKCDVCGYECTHESYTDGFCTVCGATCTHTGGEATCTEQAKCERCGTSYGELDPDNHDFGSGNTCICGAEIAFTGIVVDDENSDEYRYDETRKTYTIIIPADEVGGIGYLSYDIIGTNLTLIEDTNTLLKVQHENEDGLTPAPDDLLVDVLQDNGCFGWSVLGYGDGEWEKLLYSNDGGMTWTTYTFEVKQAYSITVNASQNGTVTANEYAIEGDNIALNVSPAEGYMLDTLSVTDASGNSVDVENNAFTMPASAVTVTATFAVCDHKDGRHETATDNGDGTHDATYSCCGATVTEGHSGGTATCTEQAECQHCGASYGEFDWTNHEGEYVTVWFNDYQHVSEYECCHIESSVVYEDHDYKDYTITTPADCVNNAWETGTCICGDTHTREIAGSAKNHDWSDKNGICTNCGEVCPHEKYTMGICDECNYLCPHSFTVFNETVAPKCEETGWEESYCDYCSIKLEQEIPALDHDWVSGGIERPSQNTDGSWSDGYYYDSCKNDEEHIRITGVAKRVDYSAYDEAYKALKDEQKNEKLTDEGAVAVNQAVMSGMSMPQNIVEGESTTAYLNNWVKNAQSILAKIANGEYVKINGLEEIVKINDKLNEELTEKYGEEALAEITDKIGDKYDEKFDELYEKAEALTGSVAENKEALEEIEAEMEAIFAEIEKCLAGVHNGFVYEVTEEAKCGVNAIESATCTLCGETDEREVEGSALEHSFTKYEVTEEAKCGVAGKEVAYCDNGCHTTDERETPALEHIFLDYVSNGDATCTADGTKTASCLNGCGTEDTVTDEGSQLDHVDEDGDKLCDDCQAEIADVCPDCGRPVHEDSGISRYICILIMLIRLIISFFKAI